MRPQTVVCNIGTHTYIKTRSAMLILKLEVHPATIGQEVTAERQGKLIRIAAGVVNNLPIEVNPLVVVRKGCRCVVQLQVATAEILEQEVARQAHVGIRRHIHRHGVERVTHCSEDVGHRIIITRMQGEIQSRE